MACASRAHGRCAGRRHQQRAHGKRGAQQVVGAPSLCRGLVKLPASVERLQARALGLEFGEGGGGHAIIAPSPTPF
jgi:hypothetical protein